MKTQETIFDRTERLIGEAGMQAVSQRRVIIFGVGGVGSWCAESLVRSGIGQLTLVDSDRVCASNVNRQGMATTKTIGQVKVEALKNKLLEINPQVRVEAVQDIYSADTRAQFHLEKYDYIIDAIDSLECKAELIRHATSLPRSIQFFSSMGAALKMDPTQICVDEFWRVKGCPLARALRQKFKRSKLFPARKFQVVYSPEVLPNLGEVPSNHRGDETHQDNETGPGRQDLLNHDWSLQKAQINGTVAHITAIFGFTLAGLVMQDIYRQSLPSGNKP